MSSMGALAGSAKPSLMQAGQNRPLTSKQVWAPHCAESPRCSGYQCCNISLDHRARPHHLKPRAQNSCCKADVEPPFLVLTPSSSVTGILLALAFIRRHQLVAVPGGNADIRRLRICDAPLRTISWISGSVRPIELYTVRLTISRITMVLNVAPWDIGHAPTVFGHEPKYLE